MSLTPAARWIAAPVCLRKVPNQPKVHFDAASPNPVSVLTHEGQSTAHDFEFPYIDRCFFAAIARMEMRWSVVRVKHEDRYSVEGAYCRHLSSSDQTISRYC